MKLNFTVLYKVRSETKTNKSEVDVNMAKTTYKVGDKVRVVKGRGFVKKVSKLGEGDYKTYETNMHTINESLGYGAGHGDKITDDTEAQY